MPQPSVERVYQGLYLQLSADTSYLLRRLQKWGGALDLDTGPFLSKWAGLPEDPAERLAELERRGPIYDK